MAGWKGGFGLPFLLPQGLMWRAAGREAVNPLLIPPSVAARDWSGAVDRPAAGGSNQAGVER